MISLIALANLWINIFVTVKCEALNCVIKINCTSERLCFIYPNKKKRPDFSYNVGRVFLLKIKKKMLGRTYT